MNELSLNQKSYLCSFIAQYLPYSHDILWELSEKVDMKERGYLLALCFKKDKEVLREVVQEKLTKYQII